MIYRCILKEIFIYEIKELTFKRWLSTFKTRTIILLTLLLMLFSTYAKASLSSDYIDQVQLMSDDILRQELESTTIMFDQIYSEYQELQKQLDELNNKIKEDPFNSDMTKRYQNLNEKKNAKGKNELQPVENRLQLLQREWEKRINIPYDYKEYKSIGKYLNEQYYKGVGTREEMVKKYEALAEKFPDSPLAVNALYDTAVLYTGGNIRENGDEIYLPDKAREYYERIIAKHPDLLSEFFIWSRGNLADLCPTADQRLKSQIELYNWLKNVKPEQYQSTIEFMKKDYRYRNRSAKILEEQINALIKTTTDILQKNMLSNAKTSSNPDENIALVNKLFASEVIQNSLNNESQNKNNMVGISSNKFVFILGIAIVFIFFLLLYIKLFGIKKS